VIFGPHACLPPGPDLVKGDGVEDPHIFVQKFSVRWGPTTLTEEGGGFPFRFLPEVCAFC